MRALSSRGLLGAALLAALAGGGCDSLTWLTTPAEPPPPPLIAEVDSPTRHPEVLVGGTKAAGTGIVLGDEEVVPIDASTSFTFLLSLEEGEQRYELRSTDGRGARSEPAAVTVELDTTAPEPPTVSPPPALTTSDSVVLQGTFDEEASLWIDGAKVILPADAAGAFVVSRPLELGPNAFWLSAQDALGNESEVVTVEVTRVEGEFTLDPVPELLNTAEVELTGTRGQGVAVEVDGEEVLAGAEAGSFSVTVPLAEGEQTLAVAGVLGADRWEQMVILTVDTVAPGTPILDPVPALVPSDTVTLSGSLPDRSSLLVDGVVVLEDAPPGAFSVEADLGGGALSLDVRARDRAGNVSAPVDPVPELYVNPAGLLFALDPAPALVGTSPLVLTGLRGADVEVWVDDELALPPDGENEFSLAVDLVPGLNELTVSGRTGPAAEVVELSLTLLDAPAAPVLDEAAITTSSPSVTVTGTRPPDTAVLRNGVVSVASGSDAAFSDPVTVEPGVTELRYSVRDALGRTSPEVSVTVTWFVDAGAPPDAGLYDGGPAPDAGLYDAGPAPDGGLLDAGAPLDAGLYDAGAPLDAGPPPDAGPVDGGTPAADGG